MRADEAKLKEVVADVFGIAVERIDENASVDTIAEWTSLNHLKLVLALEAAFDVSLSEEQTVEILSYPLIRAVLAEHQVDLDGTGH
jgi:acyl carrier protein